MSKRTGGRSRPAPLPDGRWKVDVIHQEESPTIVRVRNERPRATRTGRYRHLVAVRWIYEPGNEAGLPSPEEHARMKRLEELMEAALEPPAQAFLAGALTGGGVRFWPWYSRDPEETMRLVHKVLAGRPPFPVNFSFMEDPKWVWYHSFRGAIGP